jgi:hypothetical protein
VQSVGGRCGRGAADRAQRSARRMCVWRELGAAGPRTRTRVSGASNPPQPRYNPRHAGRSRHGARVRCGALVGARGVPARDAVGAIRTAQRAQSFSPRLANGTPWFLISSGKSLGVDCHFLMARFLNRPATNCIAAVSLPISLLYPLRPHLFCCICCICTYTTAVSLLYPDTLFVLYRPGRRGLCGLLWGRKRE